MATEKEATRIPPEQIDFCQAVMKLAKKHGCIQVNMTYTVATWAQPDDHAPWSEQILVAWEGQRHNENTRLHISTTLREYTNIYEKREVRNED